MQVKRVTEVDTTSLERLLAGVPFYNAVKLQDRSQFNTLLDYSKIVTFEPGEQVLEAGTEDQWLYFLLKGQLQVQVMCAGEGQPKVVNYITPGEVFGDLALLVAQPRTADVVADENCREVCVFGTDFRVFGSLDDMDTISLQTKLAYYRNTVHNLRWKLELYRIKHPANPLSGRHRQIKLYHGQKDTFDELVHLDQQAKALAQMLMAWNQDFGEFVTEAHELPNPRWVAAMHQQ